MMVCKFKWKETCSGS